MPSSTAPTQDASHANIDLLPIGAGDVQSPASHEEEIAALRRALQEQRRATTLLRAEAQKQVEAREAMEAQLIEANAELAASWDRRKEMARVIGDRDAKLAKLNREVAQLSARISGRETQIANREDKIAQLRSELKARYEELGALQRHIARSSLSGRAKRAAAPIKRLFR